MKSTFYAKNTVILVVVFLIMFLFFVYTNPWNLLSKAPSNDFEEVTIREIKYNFKTSDDKVNTYSLEDKSTINDLYKYLLDRNCIKVNTWFEQGFNSDGTQYNFTFTSNNTFYDVRLYSPKFITIRENRTKYVRYYLDSSFDFDKLKSIYH